MDRDPWDAWGTYAVLIWAGLEDRFSEHRMTTGHPFVCGTLAVYLGVALANTAGVSLIHL